MPTQITYDGSKQTYYTFRFLVDRDRRQDAYRSYAYFRWLDDLIDSNTGTQEEKRAIIYRQQMLLEACYLGDASEANSPEEQMLVDMVKNDHEKGSGLQLYLRNMMKVMAFDAERCGRVISHAELTEYTHMLALAVTEALFYFIDHDNSPPCEEMRYYAVCGAHVVHMLRDAVEDISSGYYNIPGEYIRGNSISVEQLHNQSFRKWVYERVKLARRYFYQGRRYFSNVKSIRCRLASAAYLARFEWMLNRIERDGYYLRASYPERKSFKAALWMAWRVLTSTIKIPGTKPRLSEQKPLIEQFEE